MASCSSCGSTIIFGGKRDGNYRFCSDKCLSAGRVLSMAERIPPAALEKFVNDIHRGQCPKCQGAGPVDVHVSHSVWSALVMTSWKSSPQISCRPCGVKRQALDATGSLFLGWWGFPWGLIMTPIQIIKNIAGMVRGPKSDRPSLQLTQQARLIMAAQMLQSDQNLRN